MSTAGALLGAVLLGGNASTGHLSDVVLQLMAIPALLVALWFHWARADRSARPVLALAAIAAVAVLQVVPLPTAIWNVLPQRAAIRSSLALIDQPAPWLPISVTPTQTWLGAISLVVPFAVFLGTLQLGFRARRHLAALFLAFITIAGVLGLAQIAQGPSSPLRFYAVTNPTEAVGFFANRNHHAALLYVGLVLAAAFALNAAMSVATSQQDRSGSTMVVALVAIAVIMVLIASQAMARSRAGLLLSLLALFGIFALASLDARARVVKGTMRLVAAAVGLAILFSAQFAIYRVMERMAGDPVGHDTRTAFMQTTLEAAWAYFPFGSGIGSFVPVYAMNEKERDILVNAYANQAHNDVAQVLLEGGLLAALVIGVLLTVGAVRTYRIWWTEPLGRIDVDRMLARAAPLVIALLLLHAFADYALRTGAIMATMAFAAALLFPPPENAEIESDDLVFARVEAPKSLRKSKSSLAKPALARNAEWKNPIVGPQTGALSPPIAWSEQPAQPASTPTQSAANVSWPEGWSNPDPATVQQGRMPGLDRSAQSGKPSVRPADAPAPPSIEWPRRPDDKS